MYVIVAMAAEVLPVGAVRRIIMMVAVLVMDSEKMSGRLVELAGAAGADQAVHLQGLLAVVGVVLNLLPHGPGPGLGFCLARQFHRYRPPGLHLSPLTTGIWSFSDASLALIRLVTSS